MPGWQLGVVVVRRGLLVIALLLSGCGQARVVSAPAVDCPTGAEIDETESEELNEIPRECDESMSLPPDQPGISVDDEGEDDEGGMPTASAKDEEEDFRPAGHRMTSDVEVPGDVDFWGLQWPGGPLRASVSSPDGAPLLAVTDLDGQVVLGSTAADATDEVEGALPSGRYFLRVFAAEDDRSTFTYTVVNRTG